MDIRTIAKASIALIIENDNLESADSIVSAAKLSLLVQSLKLKDMLPESVKPLMNTPVKELPTEVIMDIQSEAKALFKKLTKSEYIIVNVTCSIMQQYVKKLKTVQAMMELAGDIDFDIKPMNISLFNAYNEFIAQTDDELLEKYKDQLPESQQ